MWTAQHKSASLIKYQYVLVQSKDTYPNQYVEPQISEQELKYQIAQELARKFVEDNIINLKKYEHPLKTEYLASLAVGSSDHQYYAKKTEYFEVQEQYFKNSEIQEALLAQFPERFL